LIVALEKRFWQRSKRLSDHIILSLGDTPWEPSGAALEHVYFSHNGMPLAGLIDQGGTHYYFWCIDGEVTIATLWGYVELWAGSIEDARRTPSGLLKDYLLSRSGPLTVALSIDGEGLTRFDTIKFEQGIDVAEQVEDSFPLTEEETIALESV
jgi:hypothetical protein